MRLLLITNDFPNPYEPTKAVFNLYLARALGEQHDIRVVSPISWVDEWRAKRRGMNPLGSVRRAVLQGVQVQYPRYYYPPKAFRGLYGWFYWLSIRRTIKDLLQEFRPDAVLGYWIHPDGQAAVRLARQAGVASAVLVGGSDLLLLTKSSSRRRRILGVLRTADAVITVSSDLKDKMVEHGIAPDKVHLWSRGLDTDTFSPGDRQQARSRLGLSVTGKILVWVGRLVPVKGIDVLLRACALLVRQGVAFRTYLVGDGPLQSCLEAQAAELGLSEVVSFVGAQPHDQLPDWYRAADLTVLPSRSEGMPNVLRESLACGTPFVASRVGGISEIAAEPWGHLVPADNPVALADGIARKLQQPCQERPQYRVLSWADSANALVEILRGQMTGTICNAIACHG